MFDKFLNRILRNATDDLIETLATITAVFLLLLFTGAFLYVSLTIILFIINLAI